MSLRGFAAGVIGLALFETVVSSKAAAGRVGGLFTAAGALVRRALSPAVPAIPDHRSSAAPAPSSSAESAALVGPPPTSSSNITPRLPVQFSPVSQV